MPDASESNSSRKNESFKDLLDALSLLRPTQEANGKTIFDYGDQQQVYLQAGEMQEIHWMDIFIRVKGYHANSLISNKLILQMNQVTSRPEAISTWFGAEKDDEEGLSRVVFVMRANWQGITAKDLDSFILERCSYLRLAQTGSDSNSSADHMGQPRAYVGNSHRETEEKFSALLEDLARRCHSDNVDGRTVFFYGEDEANPVYLVRGEWRGTHWIDICIQLTGIVVNTLHSSKHLLQANAEMCSATPIPSWFAANEDDKALFINRLDWRHISAEVLDDHIQRCVSQMKEALVEEGVAPIIASQGCAGMTRRSFG